MARLSPRIVSRLKNRPYYAYLYAKNILKGRLPEKVEAAFVSDPQSAYLYAKEILKGRLPDFVHNGLLLGSFEESQSKQFLSMYLAELCKD